jgi:predicted Zn-dependent peptidase
MKNIIITALALFTLSACSTTSTPLDRSIRPSAAPAKANKFGESKEFTLTNGMKVMVIENHKLPTVSFNLSYDIDPIVEGDKAGYTSMVGDLMEAGTKNRSKEALNEEVDFMGANMGVYSSGAYTSGLSKYNDKLMDILADVTLNPVFPEDELGKKVNEAVEGLKSSSTNADAIMGNVKSLVLYGKGHPYGEFMTEAALKNITLDDCKNYYNTYFKPNNALLTIVGDISKEDAEKLANKYFGEWKKGTVPAHTYSKPASPTKTQVYVVNKEGAVQSNIQISNLAEIKLGDTDYEAAQVFNQIFGSGFAGRLFQNLREDKEYTYGAYGGIRANKLIGNFSSSAKVRNEVTDSAIEQFMYEINRIRTENVSAEELQNAKNYIAGTFAQSLESSRTIARFAANIDDYKLDKDYFKNYLKRIDAVTVEDIKRVSNKYMQPKNMSIIVVGEASEIGEKLARFGNLNYLDIEGNKVEAPKKAGAIPAGVTAETVFQSYYQAIGGVDKIKSIKSMTGNYTISMQGMSLKMTNKFVAPNKISSSISVAGMGVVQKVVYDGDSAKMKAQGQVKTMDPKETINTGIDGHFIPELSFSKNGVKAKLVDTKMINGKSAYHIEAIYPTEKMVNLYYDVKSGLKVKSSSVNHSPKGEYVSSEEYSDYKSVGGVLIPHKQLGAEGPQKMKIELINTEVNKPISADSFKL